MNTPWHYLIINALSNDKDVVAGRDVLVQMREAGLDAKGAEEILVQMLHGHAGKLSESQEDQIKDLADLVYGHCVKDLRVWDRDPNGFTRWC